MRQVKSLFPEGVKMQLSYKVLKDCSFAEEVEMFELKVIKIEETSNFEEEPIPDPEEEAMSQLEKVQEICENLLAEANLKAKRIEEEAHQKARMIEEEAYQKGYESGREEGLQESQLLIQKTREEAGKMLEEIEGFRQQTLENLKHEIKNLVLEITEKVIISEVKENPTITNKIVEECLSQVKNRKKVHIYVNPRDKEPLEEIKTELVTKVDDATVEIHSDSAIKIGGCRIYTEKGWIDATIDHQLQEIKTILASAS